MNLHAQIDVSVVIPTHDRPVMLRKAIASALAQDGVALEVVVVDDGSSPAVALTQEEIRSGVRLLQQPAAIGVCAARNRGIAESRGRFVAFLDDDDRWLPEKLEKQLRQMEAEGRRWSTTGTVRVASDGTVLRGFYPGQLAHAARDIETDNRIGTPSTIVAERSLLIEAGGFSPSLSVMADWELWIRLVRLAEPSVVGEPLVLYLQHSGSMHLNQIRRAIHERNRLARRHRRGRHLGGLSFWIWIARSLRAQGSPVLGLCVLAFALLRFPGLTAGKLINHARRLTTHAESPIASSTPGRL